MKLSSPYFILNNSIIKFEMKKNLFLILCLLFLFSNIKSQAPCRFNYQAVARDAGGNLILNQNISVRINILTGSASGSSEYSETHSVTTDAYGVFNLLVGGGNVESGFFNAITWGTESKFIMIEADVSGGIDYQALATTQILSMPYALYANKAGNVFSGDYNDLTNKPDTLWSKENDHIYANNVTTTSSVTISDEGFLGIGTKDPLGEFHVNKPIGFSGITFIGTGLNDLNVDYSIYNGTGDVTYTIEVINTGPDPDLIRWTDNGGTSWSSDTPMQISGISLSNGVLIGFTSTDGHTYSDKWEFSVSQGFMNGLIVKDGKVGIGTTTPDEELSVNGTIQTTTGYKFPDGTIQNTAAPTIFRRIYKDNTIASTSEGVNGNEVLHSYTIPGGTLKEELMIFVSGYVEAYYGYSGTSGDYTRGGILCLYINGVNVDQASASTNISGNGPDVSHVEIHDDVTFIESYSVGEIDFSAEIEIIIYGSNYRSDSWLMPVSEAKYYKLIIYGK